MHKSITIIGAIAISASAALGTESSVPHLKADQVHALGFDGFWVTVAVIDISRLRQPTRHLPSVGSDGPPYGCVDYRYGVSGTLSRSVTAHAQGVKLCS